MATSSVLLSDLEAGSCSSYTVEKYLAEHQNPDTLKRLNEANRAKKICRINSISIPLLVRRSVKKLFKEQEYHDAVKHHTEAIQRNPKEPTARPRGMQDPGIKNILTEL